MYYVIFLSNDIVPPFFIPHKTFQDMGVWRGLYHYCVVYFKQEWEKYAETDMLVVVRLGNHFAHKKKSSHILGILA